MGEIMLECCVDSFESAKAAKEAGAKRLELCGDLMVGGTTPSSKLLEMIKIRLDIPVHVLIRPRFGDFLYSDEEFTLMRSEIHHFRELGADGVVFGCLTKDGRLDMRRMESLMQKTMGMSVTLHRAFDVCVNPYEAMIQAVDLGIDTVLTSGQKNCCTEGKELLKNLLEVAGKDITVMVGSGVNASVIEEFLSEAPFEAFHMSGKKIIESEMEYRKPDVSMGLPMMSEYERFVTDADEVKKAAAVIEKYTHRGSRVSYPSGGTR